VGRSYVSSLAHRKRTDVSPSVFYHVVLEHSTPFFLPSPLIPPCVGSCASDARGLFPQPDPTLPYPVIHPSLLACGHGAGVHLQYQELCRAGGAMFHERYKCVSTAFVQYRHTNDGWRWVCYCMDRRWCVCPRDFLLLFLSGDCGWNGIGAVCLRQAVAVVGIF